MASDWSALLPSDFNLPYPEFRQVQIDAFSRVMDSTKRFVALAMPTGSGKSVVARMLSMLTENRAAILTATKGLQQQYMDEFTSLQQFQHQLGQPPDRDQLVNIWGRNNYRCNIARDCNRGKYEGCVMGTDRLAGKKSTIPCPYELAKRDALNAKSLVTNYKYWMSVHEKGNMGLTIPAALQTHSTQNFSMLILDEAHLAHSELAGHLEVTLHYSELLQHTASHVKPPDTEELAQWSAYILRAHLHLRSLRAAIPAHTDPDRAERLDKLIERIARVAIILKYPHVIEIRKNTISFQVVYPGAFAENHLFLRIPKVVLLSATIRPKTLALLGVSSRDYDFIDFPRVFPPNRCPVLHLSGARMRKASTQDDWDKWIDAIDRIIAARKNTKGIIHTVSYARQDYILAHSKYAHLMLANTSSPDSPSAVQVVEKFKSAAPPAILVSPSMGTGWDFPDDECRWQIVTKIPYPDISTKISKARTEQDPQYSSYVAAQELVQMAGRGMRHEKDRCETFIIDNHISYFLKSNSNLLPKWFGVRKVLEIPPAPDLSK